MVSGMAKLTISLPDAYLAAAKRHATGDETVSGLAADALRREILRRDLALLAKDGFTGEADDWYATVEADRGAPA
jgi:hypothetical protein